MRFALVVFGLVVGACASSKTASDAGEPTCVPNGGVYNCLGGSWPVCSDAERAAENLSSCGHLGGSCMYCSEGAGVTCGCSANGGVYPVSGVSDGGPGPWWICEPTGYSCQ
jgi:hypothetical protein